MIVNDQWATDEVGEHNSFIQRQVMLVDGNGVIRYSGLLRRSTPSEQVSLPVARDFQSLGQYQNVKAQAGRTYCVVRQILRQRAKCQHPGLLAPVAPVHTDRIQ
ncbi:MAG: hypothetical protein KatS3mg022_1071 [Armatimonadota bacterium]|nr:MAG: hypothetical protein KatS3mg022_1071 [Armatimonadota bacterium]